MQRSRCLLLAAATIIGTFSHSGNVFAQLPPTNGTPRPSQPVTAFPPAGTMQNSGNTGVGMMNPGGAAFDTSPVQMQQGPIVDPQTVNRSREQSQGNYGNMDRTLGVPLGMTQDAWKTPGRSMAPGQSAPGVVRFQWSPNLVMQVRVRDFMLTTLTFPAWEQVMQVYIGEQYYMQSAIPPGRGNVVLLRSQQSGIDTNVTVLGSSGNTYVFYIRSEGFNTRQITDMQVFVEAPSPASNDGWFKGSLNNPNFQAGQVTAATPVAMTMPGSSPLAPPVPGPTPSNSNNNNAAGDMLVPRDKMIFDLRMYEARPGDREILPDYAYTDGVWTYFYYGTRVRSTDQPVVLQVVDGIEKRVNTRTAGRFGEVLIAEARGDFVLKSGAKVGCIKRISAAMAAR